MAVIQSYFYQARKHGLVRKRRKEARIVRPKLTPNKVMIMLAFTGDQKFSIKVTRPGETITSDTYIKFIHNTGDKWRRLHSSPSKLSGVWWQYDNARPHVVADTHVCLAGEALI